MLDVWVEKFATGAIERNRKQEGDFVFAYREPFLPRREVSLLMPASLESYGFRNGLHPVFQMNLPEGRLRESITLAFRKRSPRFDDLALLEVVGRSQIGRLRFTNDPAVIDDVPLQSVHELVAYEGAEDLLRDLLDRFAGVSGVSGVQPKVLIRNGDASKPSDEGARITVRGATHIVKGWEPNEYPHLAANEFFCMKVAARAGLDVPSVALSENNKFLVVERFDLASDGSYLGFEDFCSLSALHTEEKYDGSYERLTKRIRDFVSPELRAVALEAFFRSLVVSCVLRNGDAHLKNFGVLYEAPDKPVRFAPAYDIVSTTPYIRGDSLALTLGGSKRFADQSKLLAFGRLQCNLQPARVLALIEEVAEATVATQADVRRHMADFPDFRDVGQAMLDAWDSGLDSICKPLSKQRNRRSQASL